MKPSFTPPIRSPQMEPSWLQELRGEFEMPYMKELHSFLVEEKKSKVVYPKGSNIFRAFWLTPFSSVKVVILGQDPYHGNNQAHGLSFSVQQGVSPPPSLLNIYKEIKSDLGIQNNSVNGCLEKWSQRGIFLLNAVLTVEAHKPGSHRGKGWEVFTDAVIDCLSQKRSGLVFMLWGKYAQEKATCIDSQKHLVLKASHPSPYSAEGGFFGCGHFSKSNAYLESHQKGPICWDVS